MGSCLVVDGLLVILVDDLDGVLEDVVVIDYELCYCLEDWILVIHNLRKAIDSVLIHETTHDILIRIGSR